MRKLKMLTLGAMLIGAAAANAGQLLSATYSQTIQGVAIDLTSTTATGTLVGNQFRLDAGNWFATAFCIANFGAVACPQATFMGAPVPPTAPTVVMNVTSMFPPPTGTGMFAAPVLGINLTFDQNGAVSGTTGQNTFTVANGITGIARVMAKVGIVATLIAIPVDAGAGATVMAGAPTLQATLFGDKWHLGAVTQTGLTDMFAATGDVMATGTVNMTAGGNTVVNLVSLGRTKLRGLANSETASPAFLRLVYAPSVPEPGTLALLGAGVAGLVLIGRRKLQ
jgi:PEP-CTERM motif